MRSSISLLCLPCAGASAMMYMRWRRLLPAWLSVVPVELPGRGSRLAESFVEDFDALVSRICDEQAPAMQGRFALFGHSMGALLASGVARRLQLTGRAMPLALVVSGSPAPSQRDAGRFAGKTSDEHLVADLREQGGTPEEVFASPELMRMTLDALRADYGVCASFSRPPAPPLLLPVHVMAGRQDDIEPTQIDAWAEEAGGVFTVDWFDGGHFFLRQHEAAFLSTLTHRLGDSVPMHGEATARACDEPII